MNIMLTLNQATHRLKQLWRSALLLALLTLLCSSFPVAQAGTGDLDTTFAGFGNRGIVTETEIRETSGLALQPDGKVLIAYQTLGTWSEILCYKPNGQRDSTFGNNGFVVIPNPALLNFFARDIAVQAGG